MLALKPLTKTLNHNSKMLKPKPYKESLKPLQTINTLIISIYLLSSWYIMYNIVKNVK
jgi:hypothetical protein